MPPLSFAIHGACGPESLGASVRQLEFDRCDSRLVLQLARRIYISFLAAAAGAEPIGIVIALERQTGRAVFEPPLLLPGERFVPLAWIRGPSASSPSLRRRRAPTAPSGVQPR